MNKFAALLGTSLLLAGNANADGFYVGGSLGAGDASLSANTQVGDFELEDRLVFVKGFGGYRVNEFFAVEGSLMAGSNDNYDDLGFDDDIEATFGAVSASLVGIAPLSDDFELYAKLGGYLGESEVEDNFFFGNRYDQDESGLLWGAGMYINFGQRKQFTIRLDYENFETDVFDDLWAVSAGFQYNFQ